MLQSFKRPKHTTPTSLTFSVLTEQNVKDISVLQIVNPSTLDALGHPIIGGLYDNRLGPCGDKNEPCGTCNKNANFCSGHFGFIDLPVPCENPIFHKVIGTLLRYSCLSCHKLQLTEESRRKIELLAKQDESELNKINLDKVIFEEVKLGKICIYCKSSMKKIQVLANRILMITRNKPEKDDAYSSVKPVVSKYVDPKETQEYLRKIWDIEQDFLRLIKPVLNNVDTPYPTDVFFFKVIPVPPPNVRPLNFLNGRVIEHPQTALYKSIISNSIIMNQLIPVVKNKGDTSVLTTKEAKDFYQLAKGKTAVEKLNNCWEELKILFTLY